MKRSERRRSALVAGLSGLLLGAILGVTLAPRLRATTSAVERYARIRVAAANAQLEQVGDGYILIVGDSHIERLYLPRLCDLPTVTFGLGGAAAADLTAALSRLIPIVAPRAIVLSVGTNDLISAGTSDHVAAFGRDARVLVARLRELSPHIVVTDVPAIRSTQPGMLEGAAARYGGALEALCRTGACTFAPIFAEFGATHALDLKPDGVHLSDYRAVYGLTQTRLCAA